jgi:type I restriction enzyme R subunit
MGTISAEVIMSAPDDRSTGDDHAEEVTEPVVRFWKTMMAKYGGEEEYNRQITEGFKKREEPELLIVISKLLTGFDAPVDTVLYIDKSTPGDRPREPGRGGQGVRLHRRLCRRLG